MFDIGLPELLLILIVALIVFGPGRLPEIGAALGRGIREFRQASADITKGLLRPEDEEGASKREGDDRRDSVPR